MLLADDSAKKVLAYGRETDKNKAAVSCLLNVGNSAQTVSVPVGGYLPEGTALYSGLLVGSVARRNERLPRRGRARRRPLSGLVLKTGHIDLKPPAAPSGLPVG